MQLMTDHVASAEGKTDDGLANANSEFSDHCVKVPGFSKHLQIPKMFCLLGRMSLLSGPYGAPKYVPDILRLFESI